MESKNIYEYVHSIRKDLFRQMYKKTTHFNANCVLFVNNKSNFSYFFFI